MLELFVLALMLGTTNQPTQQVIDPKYLSQEQVKAIHDSQSTRFKQMQKERDSAATKKENP